MGGPSDDSVMSATSKRESFPVRFMLLGLVTVLAVGFGFLFFSVNDARLLVQKYGYYTMALTFAWAVVALVKVVPEWTRSWPRLTRPEYWALIGSIAGLTAVAVITVPYTYKVLYDEFVLQSTAWGLHEARTVGTIVRGYDIGGVFTTMQTYLDKRPFFYAFLVSLLHDLAGYREANAFALNTVLMPMILVLTYLFARRLSSHLGALAGMVALGAFSLLAQNATGSGMEMLNLTMLLVVMHLSWWYLESPSGSRLSALLLCSVLLTQTRYESALYVAPVALIVLEGWRRDGRMILPAAAILAPALLIPYALHSTYLSGTPLLWELREGEASRFSVQYLPNNIFHALLFFFDFSGRLINSWWLGVAGLPALIWSGWMGCRQLKHWRRATSIGVVMFIFGVAITANLGLLMFYYWGQLDDPIVARLSLPFSVLLVLCIAWATMQFYVRLRRRAAYVAIGGALLAYLSSGLLSNATHWTLNLQAREIAWEVDFVKSLPPKSRLVLTNKSALIWLSHEISSIQIVHARIREEQIRFHMCQHTFGEVLVLQTYRPVGPEGGFQLEPLDRLADSFILEPLIERRFGTHAARISRVVRIESNFDPMESLENVSEEARDE
ncbi:MAG: hypothetical protein CMI16_04280 [Opitutaceae bacterium]|nr:hypothetical protein [Opitutaceae bacterium]